MNATIQDVKDYFRNNKFAGYFPLQNGGAHPRATGYRYNPQDNTIEIRFQSMPKSDYRRMRNLLDLDIPPISIYEPRRKSKCDTMVVGDTRCKYCRELVQTLQDRNEDFQFFDFNKENSDDVRRANEITGLASLGNEYIPQIYYRGVFVDDNSKLMKLLDDADKIINQKSRNPFVNRVVKRVKKKKKKSKKKIEI